MRALCSSGFTERLREYRERYLPMRRAMLHEPERAQHPRSIDRSIASVLALYSGPAGPASFRARTALRASACAYALLPEEVASRTSSSAAGASSARMGGGGRGPTACPAATAATSAIWG